MVAATVLFILSSIRLGSGMRPGRWACSVASSVRWHTLRRRMPSASGNADHILVPAPRYMFGIERTLGCARGIIPAQTTPAW
jgi:hypothetical protein